MKTISRTRHVSHITILMVALLVVLVNFSHHKWQRGGVIKQDVKSYYSYLPAVFIYHDIALRYIEDRPDLLNETWPVTLAPGQHLIVTSYGLSVLYAPFFLLAHAYASISEAYPASGYSMPYRLAIQFSAVVYWLLGMFTLRRLLRRYFAEGITALVLFVVAVGTNLAYFTTYKAPMPHAYNFLLITWFTLSVVQWYARPTRLKAAGLGLLFGFIVLVRPSNIVAGFILLLWDVTSWRSLKERVQFYWQRADFVAIMILLAFVVWVPQFAYWHRITGQWVFFSYGAKEARFFWGNPQIQNILFSYKKGWWVYTPVMFLATLGIATLPRQLKAAFWAVLVFFAVNLYVQASWWSWWFGGAFGNRAFIDSYGLMALPLAALLQYSRQWRPGQYSLIFVLFVLTAYNAFQIQQFRNQAIHYWWNNKAAYWENFLRLKPTDDYHELVRVPDYYLARQGIYVAIRPQEKWRRDTWRKYRDQYAQDLLQSPAADTLWANQQSNGISREDMAREYAHAHLVPRLKANKRKIIQHMKQHKEWNTYLKKQAKAQNLPLKQVQENEFQRILDAPYE